LEILKCESLPALTYSPPAPRTIDAILAKFSEPKNLRGFIMMYSSWSSKNSISSNSFGNSALTSLVEPSSCLVGAGIDVCAGAVTGAGEGALAVFSAFEMSAKSFEMSFKTTRSWSIFCITSSTDCFFSLIASPRKLLFAHCCLFCFVLVVIKMQKSFVYHILKQSVLRFQSV